MLATTNRRAVASRLQRVWTLHAIAGLLMSVAVGAPAMAQKQDLPPEIIFNERPNQTQLRSNGSISLPTPSELQGVKVDPALREMVNQLEDPSFAAREAATQKLLESHPDRLQLYAILANSSDLTAEQRYRVLTVLRECLVNSPRGAIGISMQPVGMMMGGQIEIRVTELLPGLPAERVLKIGDRIVEVDGRPLTQIDDLQFRVQSKQPGDKVTLAVKRAKPEAEARAAADPLNDANFDVLHFEVELGDANLLRTFNQQLLRANQFNQLNQFQNAGFQQQVSRVEAMRLLEMRNADERLAPKPRKLPIKGDSRLMQTAVAKSTERGAEGLAGFDVDQHPYIQQLIWQQQQVADGGLTAEQVQMLADQWQRQLADLVQQSQNRLLPPDQREYLQRVIDRFADLLDR